MKRWRDWLLLAVVLLAWVVLPAWLAQGRR